MSEKGGGFTMKRILLDEQNVGTAISWFRSFMQKQYRLQKIQYDRESKKWVLTLEKVYPSSGDVEVSKQTDQNENLNLVGDVV